jgi:hypothetical protein
MKNAEPNLLSDVPTVELLAEIDSLMPLYEKNMIARLIVQAFQKEVERRNERS